MKFYKIYLIDQNNNYYFGKDKIKYIDKLIEIKL